MAALSALLIAISLSCFIVVLSQPETAATDYCNTSIYGKGHTMCLYKERELGPDCATWKNAAIVEISEATKKEIIDAHNEYRSNVALGNELSGNPGPQPKAANMNFVAWDNELATIAERFAIQCSKEFHDSNRWVARFGASQNTWPNSGFDPETGIVSGGWKSLVTLAYDEVADMDPANFVNGGNTASNGKIVGHYRNVVYGSLSVIGCGAVSWINEWGNPKIKVACNYGGPNNPGNEATYVVGPPASQCPDATKGNETTGLCEPLPVATN